MPAPTNGLILFWNQETLTGAQMKDLSATGNHGTLTGTSDKAGQVGRCRGFDGIDDQIVADSTPTVASYTIAFWAKPTVSGSNLPVSMDAVGLNYISYGIISANKWSVSRGRAGSGVVMTSAVTVATGAWHHIAARYNSNVNGQLFIDGVSRASTTGSLGSFTWNSFRIGQRVGGLNLYRGDLDELRVYNRYLTEASVIDIYSDTTQYPVVVSSGGIDLYGIIRSGQRKVMHVSRKSLAEVRRGE